MYHDIGVLWCAQPLVMRTAEPLEHIPVHLREPTNTSCGRHSQAVVAEDQLQVPVLH